MALGGSQKLAVLLCKFTDDATEPHAVDFYQKLFAQRNTGGLNDYWIAASLGAINLDGSDIYGWRTIQQTQAAFVAARPSRWDKIQGAIDAFPEVKLSDYYGVVAMYNVDVTDAGRSNSGVLASVTSDSVTFLAHETGHLFALEHSFDQSDRKDATWSAPGEYFDMYDIMSAMNVYSTGGSTFGSSGPLLCVANLDRQGWLPAARVWTAQGGNSSTYDEIDIVSLSHPEIGGYLAARAGGEYVEFRTMEGWDAGVQPCVLIHTMPGNNAIVMAEDRANYVNDWQPGQTYGPSDLLIGIEGGIQIKIISFDLEAKKARIGIRVVARRPIVVGPGTVFGGVEAGGEGVIIVNGHVYRVPPHSPAMALAQAMVHLGAVESSIEAVASKLGIKGGG